MIFNGVKGIFPKNKNVVVDHSGCLGSYILYREPGDFVFIAASILGRFLCARKRLNMDEVNTILTSQYQPSSTSKFTNQFPYPYMHPKEWYYFCEKYMDQFYGHGFPFPMSFPSSNFSVFGNQLVCSNVSDTVHHLSLINIGELVFSIHEGIRTNENAYRLLNTVIRYLRQQHSDEVGRMSLLRYMPEGAPIFEELDMRGIRIGLIHTISEVGQG